MKNNILSIAGFSHEGNISTYVNDAFKYVALERLNRSKNSGLRSMQDLDFCLKFVEAQISDIDTAIWVEKSAYTNSLFGPTEIKKWFETLSKSKKTHIIDHHHAHQANSYYTSSFDNALVVSVDDVGDGISLRLSIGSDNKLTDIGYIDAQLSLGRLWEGVNILLGYDGPDNSGKTMALSAYGKSAKYFDFFSQLIEQTETGLFRFKASESFPPIVHKMFGQTYNGNYAIANYISINTGLAIMSREMRLDLGIPEPKVLNTTQLQDYYDLVLSLQKFTNYFMSSIIQYHIKKTNIRNVCLSGGVALNSVMNSYILENTDAENVYIPPSCSDCGLSIGGLLFYRNNIQQEDFRLNPFLPYYTIENEINEDILKKFSDKVVYKKIDGIAKQTAQLIAKGKIVGWYQGGSEIGPRALGHRSILAHPGYPGMKDKINKQIKHREIFRPFAPVVLENRVSEYFRMPKGLLKSPYMLFVVDIKPEMLDKVLEIAHYDNTGRVQTINEEQNKLLCNVISEFEKITGLPVLLNTSFNGNSEPIVHSPEDAIRCFLTNKIDHLVMGNYLLSPKT